MNKIIYRIFDSFYLKNNYELEISEGVKYWYYEGLLHKEGGPAMIFSNGVKFWYLKDKLHRIGGPAIEMATRNKFYLEGIEYTEEEYWIRLNENNL